MASGPTKAVGEGDSGRNRLASQVGGWVARKPSPYCNDTMVVTCAREASTSHIRNPSNHVDWHSQVLELLAPPPPSLVD